MDRRRPAAFIGVVHRFRNQGATSARRVDNKQVNGAVSAECLGALSARPEAN